MRIYVCYAELRPSNTEGCLQWSESVYEEFEAENPDEWSDDDIIESSFDNDGWHSSKDAGKYNGKIYNDMGTHYIYYEDDDCPTYMAWVEREEDEEDEKDEDY